MKLDFFETIFKRKSVRKYDLNPLDDNILFEIESFVNKVEPLYKNIETEIRIVQKEGVNVLLPIRAPHYLVMNSENKEGYLTNAGYMLQQVDLFLSSKGIGSCYLGMALPTKVTKKASKLEFVIVLAFGKPEEAVHRTDISEFKRKALSEITSITDSGQLLEAARLAPSATNSQPWYFTGGKGVVNLYCVKSNIIKAMVYDKMNKIDMGIALYHIAVSANHLGKKIEIIFDETMQEDYLKGYYYIVTAIIK